MSLFYVTPIIYPVEMVPDKFISWMKLNPMLHMVMAFQDILYYKRNPDFQTLLVIMISSMVIIVIGYIIFQKLQRNFVEEL